jgi:Mlc titration factor MtfA (ptsG expression regulator)
MPVLISATAIQLTFGLSRYKFPFFENMQIHSEEYFADNSLRVLAGHVQGNTVTVSWKHLLQGIKNGTDGSNVGLHEMAHAFYVQCTEGDIIKGKRIIHHLNEIMAEGQDVYDLREKGTVLFSDYAFKDLQEFWAESIEIFFEKPKEMQAAYPELFESLVELLQQNPINSTYPING